MAGSETTYFAGLGEVNLERFGVVLKAERRHREQNIFAVDGLSLLLLALFRG